MRKIRVWNLPEHLKLAVKYYYFALYDIVKYDTFESYFWHEVKPLYEFSNKAKIKIVKVFAKHTYNLALKNQLLVSFDKYNEVLDLWNRNLIKDCYKQNDKILKITLFDLDDYELMV